MTSLKDGNTPGPPRPAKLPPPAKGPRVEMPCQEPDERVKNFQEVALGYTPEMAMAEASRCLRCPKPKCVQGCPVEVNIPGFIQKILVEDFEAAYKIIESTNALPAVCGRVCPQEIQCEGKCVLSRSGRPIAIGRLERFAADCHLAKTPASKGAHGQEGSVSNAPGATLQNLASLFSNGPDLSAPGSSGLDLSAPGSSGQNLAAMNLTEEASARASTKAAARPRKPPMAACLGSGPSSLTVAGDLVGHGVKVAVFEALHRPGGVLIYGIPEFRLPKADIVNREIELLSGRGVIFLNNVVGGRTILIEELFENGFEAVFIGVGAGLPVFLSIPGESLVGVVSANEYLTRANLGMARDFPRHDTPTFKGLSATVFGAGNVAMDAARVARRLGAEKVSIVYRRTRQEMPCRLEELEHALEEGVELKTLSSPLRFLGSADGRLKAVELQRMELGPADESGRQRPVPIEGRTSIMPTDLAIIAVGTRPNPLLMSAVPGLALDNRGYVKTDPHGETSMPGVYAGGDIVTGAATVILAMGAGRKAAKSILRRLFP